MKFSDLLKRAAVLLWFVLLPAAAFFAGYEWTDQYFRKKMIPFPFERYGLAIGFACFFWVLGLLIAGRSFSRKRRRSI